MCTVTVAHPVALFSLLLHIRVKRVVGGYKGHIKVPFLSDTFFISSSKLWTPVPQ